MKALVKTWGIKVYEQKKHLSRGNHKPPSKTNHCNPFKNQKKLNSILRYWAFFLSFFFKNAYFSDKIAFRITTSCFISCVFCNHSCATCYRSFETCYCSLQTRDTNNTACVIVTVICVITLANRFIINTIRLTSRLERGLKFMFRELYNASPLI